jgi:hypothetical protein
MKKMACLLGVLLVTVTSGCTQKSSNSNLLIGKWKLVSGSPQGCDAMMSFSAKQGTFVDSEGHSRSMDLSYVAADQDKLPATVYVITDAGVANHTTWNFSDKNTVQLDSYSMCTFKRQ